MNGATLSGAWRIYVRAVAFGLVVMFTVGAAGHLIPSAVSWMLRVTPAFSLLTTAMVLVPYIATGGRSFLLWAAVGYAFALLLDVAGLSYAGMVGQFEFGETLGWKWRGVPLLVGVNWMMVLNGAVCAAGRVIPPEADKWRRPAVALLAGLILVVFDLLMEPAAARLDYWHWAEGFAPVRNYVMIFISAVLFAAFHPRQNQTACDLGTTGRLAGIYVGLQMAFFLVLLAGWRWLG